MADCASAFFLFCSSSSFTSSSLTRLVSLFGSSSWEALAASSRQSGGGGVDGLPLVGIARPLPFWPSESFADGRFWIDSQLAFKRQTAPSGPSFGRTRRSSHDFSGS